jgi:phosphoserine aminotransferase
MNPGPGIIAPDVLQKCHQELLNYRGTNISVMEMSHRQSEFQEISENLQKDFRKFMKVPDNFHVFLMNGGGIANFSSVPLNLGQHVFNSGSANYIVSG